MSVSPVTTKRRPWFLEIPRKIARAASIALPFTLFAAAIAFLYGVPYLVDRGAFDPLLREKISQLLQVDVTFGHAQIQNVNELVLENVAIRVDSPVIEKLAIGEVRVRFTGPVPLGSVDQVDVAALQARVNIDSARIDALAAEAEKRAERTGKKKKRWQDRFEIDLDLPEGLAVPRIRLHDSILEGLIGQEQYRITGLHGTVETVGRSIPFSFLGSSAGHPDPFFKLLGMVERSDSGSALAVQEFKLGEMGVTVSLNTAGGLSTLTFDLRAAAVTRELAQLIQIVSGGAEVSGKLNGRSVLVTRSGQLERFEFHATAEGYSVKTAGARADSDKPTVIDLIATPAPGSLDLTLTVERMRFTLTDGSLLLGDRFQLRGTLDDLDGRFHWAKGHFGLDKVNVVAGPLKGSEFSRCDVDFDVKRVGESETYESEIDVTARDLFIEHSDRIHDFSSGLVRAAVHTREEPARRLYQVTHATLHIPEVGILQASAVLQDLYTGPLYELTLSGDRLSLAGLFRRLQDEQILDSKMQGEGEVTGSLGVRGGPWGSDLQVEARLDSIEFRHAAWRVRDLSGMFTLKSRSENEPASERLGLRLEFQADRLWLGNLELDKPKGNVPLALNRGTSAADELLPTGWLECEGLTMKELQSGPKRFTMVAKDNGFAFAEGLELTGLGGHLSIGPITVKEFFTRDFEVKTSKLEADDLEIDKLFALFKLEKAPVGKTFFRVDQVDYTRERLLLNGQITLQMLGGNVYLQNPEITDPFTEFASYGCTFDFQHVSLKQAWRKILQEGVLRGSVRGQGKVSLFNTGEPNEFWVWMEIDEDYPKKEHQYLDIAAVKKVIQTLQNDDKAADGLDKMPYKEVTYGEFGAYVRLRRNGKMSFRGKYYRPGGQSGGAPLKYSLEQLQKDELVPGAQEYLMVGAGFTPLNIINSTPLNLIQWSDFIARMRGPKSGAQPSKEPDDDK